MIYDSGCVFAAAFAEGYCRATMSEYPKEFVKAYLTGFEGAFSEAREKAGEVACHEFFHEQLMARFGPQPDEVVERVKHASVQQLRQAAGDIIRYETIDKVFENWR